MPTVDFTPAAPDLTRLADRQPEVAWTAFVVAAMVQVHDLGEKARQMISGARSQQATGPEQAANALLDSLYEMAGQGTFDPRLAEMTIDEVQVALYRNITVPARWNSWEALAVAMEEAANEVANTVTGIADEYEEILIGMEALENPDDAERRSIKPIRNSIATMRFLVDQVRYGRTPPQA